MARLPQMRSPLGAIMQGEQIRAQGAGRAADILNRSLVQSGQNLMRGMISGKARAQRADEVRQDNAIREQRLTLERTRLGMDRKLKSLNMLSSERDVAQQQLQMMLADGVDPSDPMIAAQQQKLQQLNGMMSSGRADFDAMNLRGTGAGVAALKAAGGG